MFNDMIIIFFLAFLFIGVVKICSILNNILLTINQNSNSVIQANKKTPVEQTKALLKRMNTSEANNTAKQAIENKLASPTDKVWEEDELDEEELGIWSSN